MKLVIILILLYIIYPFGFIYAQDDIQIGSSGRESNSVGALFDYSNPSGVNFRVQLWGYVRYPGFYIIPAGTSINELLSLAGGPMEDANLSDIRVVKIKEGSQTVMMKYNYNDLVWEDNIKTQIKYTRLDAGDIIVVPGEPRYFVREDVTFYLGILSALASISALVISIIILTE